MAYPYHLELDLQTDFGLIQTRRNRGYACYMFLPKWLRKIVAGGFWRWDNSQYQKAQKIEHQVWSRRQYEYREERYRLRQEAFDRIPLERSALARAKIIHIL